MTCTGCAMDLPDYMMDAKGRCPQCSTNYDLIKRSIERGEPANGPKQLFDEAWKEVTAEREAKRPAEAAATAEAIGRLREHHEVESARKERVKAAAPVLQAHHEDVVEETREKEQEATEARALARKELARRALARKHLLPYVRYQNPSYQAGWVHKDICRRLERFSRQVAEQKSPRLMLFMPPRHGKSLLASQNFPAWHLGNYPKHDIITASYSASLATDFSKKIRAQLQDKRYGQIFPKQGLDAENRNAEGWMTRAGGMFVPAGVGGPITGRGAHILTIDDPVKNREEAESATTRASIKDWYTSTAYTRLAPGGGILIILTRWHDDDLAGWLLEQEANGQGDSWEVIRYPAIATEDEAFRQEGEPLHPDRYPIEALTRIKNAVGVRDWQALYQQDPVAEDGDFFKAPDFRYYTPAERPNLDDLTVYAAWDFAIGTKEHNDFTVGIVVGIDRALNVWVLDMYRGRWGSLEIIDQMFACYDRWRPAIMGAERGQIEMALGPLINEQKRQRRKMAMRIEPLKPGKRDKQVRASPIRGLIEMHRVHFPRSAPWFDDLVAEMLRFPNGKHDDQVDSLAWIGQMIEQFNPRPVITPKPKKSWRDKLEQYVVSGSKGSSMAS